MNKKKNIVIAGAGFAGLKTALTLAKKLKSLDDYEIILVDEKNIHVYTPDLYEIATAFHEKITQECLTRLKETVATPLPKILQHRGITFIREKISALDPERKKIILEQSGDLPYEYLVLALGSVVNFYGIPGLQQFSYPLKTLTDAIAINCHLDHYLQTFWQREEQKKISIVVGGGGATGVECASELPGYFKKLCKKYHYPRASIDITLIEGTEALTGQGEKVTAVILKRFYKLGIKALLGTFIKEVTATDILVETKGKMQRIPRDILLWTGGVKPHPLISASLKKTAKNGGLPVNEFLQSVDFADLYAAGDNTYFQDKKSEKPCPMLAQVALQQGRIVAHNIIADITKQKKKTYRLKLKGVIIPLGGAFAILKTGNFVVRGYFVWLLQRLIDLWYALSILPFFYAVRKWIRGTRVFVEND